jgi:general secretion pathway protein D
VRFFDDAQVLSLLQAAQVNCRTNIMQAPKLTLLNGQCSVLDVTEPKRFFTGLTVAAGEDGHPVVTPHTEEVPVGLRMTARPIISADRRFVKVSLNVDMTDAEDAGAAPPTAAALQKMSGDEATLAALRQLARRPQISRLAMDSTFAVPDGGTALISGWKRERETRREVATPVLSDIPYVNRLFTNVGCGRETECVLLMVTPRVIGQEEEAERATGKTPEHLCPCPPKEAPCSEVKRCRCAEAAELVEKYHKACAEGRADEATRLAVQALAVDPTCFHAAPAERTRDR